MLRTFELERNVDKDIPLYILRYMKTKTILNIKTEKELKEAAQETAKDIGIPLGTAINAFLKQFVRDREITLSANSHTPTPYLQKIIMEAEEEYKRGEAVGPFNTAEDMIASLRSK